MNLPTDSSWKKALEDYFTSAEWSELSTFINSEYETREIYPEKDSIFKALDLCPINKTKVVMIGQDPYHKSGQAHGLSFSVQNGVKTPPSLRNIFKELEADTKIVRTSTNLTDWAQQGVLLLNSVLTVRDQTPGSHVNHGWEKFTDLVIRLVSENTEGVVFILWGSYAQKKGRIINTEKHLVLNAPHPSPLSAYRGFFGSRPFSQINNYLQSRNKKPISW